MTKSLLKSILKDLQTYAVGHTVDKLLLPILGIQNFLDVHFKDDKPLYRGLNVRSGLGLVLCAAHI